MFNCIELEKTMVGAVEWKYQMPNNVGSPNLAPSVLFVCIHNAGRSQMAAGWLRHLAGDRVNIYSGGSEPAEHINPAAVAAMGELGIDISQETPKLFTTDTVKAADVVITMGCGDTCPIFHGKKYEDWPLEDPAGQGVDAVRPIRDDIGLRVKNLLTELGIEFS
jgi:arsenate reductase (thioredoxin)